MALHNGSAAMFSRMTAAAMEAVSGCFCFRLQANVCRLRAPVDGYC